MLSGQIASGRQIELSDIDSTWSLPVAGVYIASAAGRTWRGKAAVVATIQQTVSHVSPVWVFGRPVTKDSFRLMTRLGFKPISDHKGIWHRKF
jgi:hypothetical protein